VLYNIDDAILSAGVVVLSLCVGVSFLLSVYLIKKCKHWFAKLKYK